MAEQEQSTNQQTPFDSILAQSRDLISHRLSDSLAAMLDKVEETLTAMLNESQNKEAQELYRDARDKTLAQREDIERNFRTRFLKEFQQRTNRVKKIGQSFSDVDLSGLELNLVGDEDLNETLKFKAVAEKLRKFCDEELVALDQRVGVLLGDADLQSEDNPFSPQSICDAYRHTCKQVDPDSIKVRMVLLKLFDDNVVDDIRSVYKDVNALLVKNSILPKIRYGVSKTEGGKTPAAGGKEDDGAPDAAAKAEKPSEQDFFALLQNLVKSGVGGGGGIPGVPPGGQVVVLQGAELLGSLTRLQHGDASAVTGEGGAPMAIPVGDGTTNVLKELKATSVGAGMGQMDAMTLDIVSMLFDQLFDEPKIPSGAKGLIGRLQIPMLKVAIADKDFFSKKTHPARALLDTLGEIAVRLPPDFNTSSPLFARLEAIIQELLTGFQDNVEIFNTVREKLQALIAEEDQRQTQETQATAKRIEQQESLAVAKTAAQDEIRARVRVGKTWRPAVDFLVQHWIKFLLLVHVKRGKDSDVWKNALETIDQLIWSVEPKAKIEERRKLAAMVPALVKRLSAGLKAAGVEDAVATKFFGEMIKRHTDIIGTIKPGEADKPDAVQPAAAEGAPTAPAGATAAPGATPPAATVPAPAPAGAAAGSKDAGGKAAPAPAAKPAAAPPGAAAAAKVPPPKGAPPPAAKPAAPAKAGPPKETDPVESLDFTAEVTVKNPFGAGEVKVDEMDFTGGTSGPAPAPAAAAGARGKRGPSDTELTDKLVKGIWVEFHEKNPDNEEVTSTPAKLSFVSPQKSRFLFIDRSGKTVLECSRAEIARRLRLGDAAVMDEAPLFDRIMSGLVGKLRGGAPAAAAH